MSYDLKESSAFDGNPVELYEFRNGNNTWRFTSADETITYLGNDYVPEQVQRNETHETQELNKLTLKVTLPRTNVVATMFQFYPPTDVTSITILRLHRDDGNAIIQWMGRVLNSEYTGVTVELHCEPITTSVRRLGLRRYYQRQCPHALYGAQCKVNKDAHKTIANVVSIDALKINVSQTLTVNAFAGGMLSWVSFTGIQWRFITGNSANSISVNLPFPPDTDVYGRGLPAGTELSVYPGCQHTMTDCISIFNNLANYGGFPFIPITNPFNLQTLY